MFQKSRREFLGQLAAGSIALPGLHSSFSSTASAAQNPESYDLVVANGRVIDPSQNLSAERDVAIAGGRIARVAANIPRNTAKQVFDARGKIVTPGLINIHSHVYLHGITSSIDPDALGVPNGVTTFLDCGSTGTGTFMGFRKYVIEKSQARIHALLNISSIGLAVTNEIYLDPAMINPEAVVRTIEQNRDVILGIKVRVNGDERDLAHDIDVLKKARQAADAAGVPIMLHWTNEPDLLKLLKRGDILAHPFNPPPPTPLPAHHDLNLLGGSGAKVLPQILELKDRGIWTDGQAARSHHAWEVSEKAASQGWFPDAISTDLGRAADTPNGFDTRLLHVVMSQYLYLGLKLEEVIARVTTNPAKMVKFPEKLGTLETGTPADVSVFNLVDGSFPFVDGRGVTRTGRQMFVPVATVKAGKLFKAAAG